MLLAIGMTHRVLGRECQLKSSPVGSLGIVHQAKSICLARLSQPLGYLVGLVQTRADFIEYLDGGESSHESCFIS